VRVATFGEKPCAAKVDFKHSIPFGNGQTADFPWARHTGIGNESVKAAEFRHCRVYKFCSHIDVAKVAGQRNGIASQSAH
jgi:hypothetical protein